MRQHLSGVPAAARGLGQARCLAVPLAGVQRARAAHGRAVQLPGPLVRPAADARPAARRPARPGGDRRGLGAQAARLRRGQPARRGHRRAQAHRVRGLAAGHDDRSPSPSSRSSPPRARPSACGRSGGSPTSRRSRRRRSARCCAPPPARLGPLGLDVVYLAAAAEAKVGGDLYEVTRTAEHGIRVIMGDVRGKGLGAVELAADVLGMFRELAHDACTLAELAARLDAGLGQEPWQARGVRHRAARRDRPGVGPHLDLQLRSPGAAAHPGGGDGAAAARDPHGGARARRRRSACSPSATAPARSSPAPCSRMTSCSSTPTASRRRATPSARSTRCPSGSAPSPPPPPPPRAPRRSSPRTAPPPGACSTWSAPTCSSTSAPRSTTTPPCSSSAPRPPGPAPAAPRPPPG